MLFYVVHAVTPFLFWDYYTGDEKEMQEKSQHLTVLAFMYVNGFL